MVTGTFGSFFKAFNDGGIFMWPILVSSIFGLAVILEKTYYFFKYESDMTDNFKKTLIELIKEGNKNKIVEYCSTKKNSAAKTVKNILESFDEKAEISQSYGYLDEIAKETILEQITSLEKGMHILSIVSNCSTQLGLLGTVTGMIAAFSGLSIIGAGNPAAVAGGISEALYTTAFGLIVGIPALVFYGLFDRKIDCVLTEMEKMTVYLTNDLRNKNFDREKCRN